MDLIEEFKQKILCSKQLLEKCKYFQNYEKRHLDKGLDDFSDHITDSIDIDLNIENGNYIVSCLESEEELKEYTYFNMVKTVLEKLKCNLDIRLYLTSIGLNSRISVTCCLKFDIKYYYEQNAFKLKSITECYLMKCLKQERSGFRIFSKDDDFEYKENKNSDSTIFKGEETTLGYCNSEEKSLLILSQLEKDKEYLLELDSKLKIELFNIFQFIKNGRNLISNSSLLEITNEEKDDVKELKLIENVNQKLIEVNNSLSEYLIQVNRLLNTEYTSYLDLETIDKNKIINSWLDKNCKKELRNLIEINKYNYYFSDHEKWINFVWFLEDNVIINFVKV